MFQKSKLPRFTFVEDGNETILDLALTGNQINNIASQIAKRFSANDSVGLIFRSGPQLVITWLAVLLAGRTPCILQYPTSKLSHDYWQQSLRHTIVSCSINGLIHGLDLIQFRPETIAPSLLVDKISCSEPSRLLEFPQKGSILQLSSGTTGHKKGIRFTFDQLIIHTKQYNKVLQLTDQDTLISWLPLYHDMGFIACFIMPLLLGIPVIMIDPINWVHKPSLLFESIQRHSATICFMPNFGFAVMSHHPPQKPLHSIRQWVSCSEPVYPQTMENFQRATGADPSTLSTCYGMAENVFAVTQSSGLKLVKHSGKTLVSCGYPIPNTHIKIIDNEIWVKSDHAMHSYIDGEKVLDNEGFYATGDLGFLHEGMVVVTGRKMELANIGGRKFMLNDLDIQIASLFQASTGRLASLIDYDETLGTEKIIFLVETKDFWKTRTVDFHQSVHNTTGLDIFELHFVPPFFITKTSSGKINRKQTLADWKAIKQHKRPFLIPENESFAQKVKDSFGSISQQLPVEEVIDSLGTVVLRLLCEDYGIIFNPADSIEQMILKTDCLPTNNSQKIFSIIALTDGLKLGVGKPWGWLDKHFLEIISNKTGYPVHFEHLIAPPAPILFSDLIFADYFLPRKPGPEGRAFLGCIQKIKRADLILVDDEDNFRLLETSVYPCLDHRFQDEASSAFLAYRFARYIRKHHLLPKKVIPGAFIDPENITYNLTALQTYLKKPIMKLAFIEEFAEYTKDWEYKDYHKGTTDFTQNPIAKQPLQEAIIEFISTNINHDPCSQQKPNHHQTKHVNQLISVDPQHFCSFLINPEALLWVIKRYNSFCILGFPWNLPALEKSLQQLGKHYHYATSWETNFEPFDCIIMTGVDGLPQTSKPIFDFVHAAGRPGRPRNLPEAQIKECPFFYSGVPEELKALSLRDLDRMPIGNFWLNRKLAKKMPDD